MDDARNLKWADGLSSALARKLMGAGYASKEEVIDGINQGEIAVKDGVTGTIPGLGKKSLEKIKKWAGVETNEERRIREAIAFLEKYGYRVQKP